MVGGLLYSYYASSYFDSHMKEFRLLADIMNDIGLTLDMLSPQIQKSYRLYVSIAATLCKVVCGISAGATKGGITQHFAKHNIADLNAKEGTQETLVSLIGMLLGILLARSLQNMEQQCQILSGTIYSHSALLATWLIFIVLTYIHIWANYIGVKILKLRIMNRERAEVALENVIQSGIQIVKEDMKSNLSDKIAMKKKILEFKERMVILSPSQCNESLLLSLHKMLFPGDLKLGVRLSKCLEGLTYEEISPLVEDVFQNEKYLLVIRSIAGRASISNTVNVVLRVGAKEDDELKAFIHAIILKNCIDDTSFSSYDKLLWIMRSKSYIHILLQEALSIKTLENLGWNTKLLLGFCQWRATWNDEHNKDI